MLEILLKQVIKSLKKKVWLPEVETFYFFITQVPPTGVQTSAVVARTLLSLGERALCPHSRPLLPECGWREFVLGRAGWGEPHSVWVRGSLSFLHVPWARNLIVT